MTWGDEKSIRTLERLNFRALRQRRAEAIALMSRGDPGSLAAAHHMLADADAELGGASWRRTKLKAFVFDSIAVAAADGVVAMRIKVVPEQACQGAMALADSVIDLAEVKRGRVPVPVSDCARCSCWFECVFDFEINPELLPAPSDDPDVAALAKKITDRFYGADIPMVEIEQGLERLAAKIEARRPWWKRWFR